MLRECSKSEMSNPHTQTCETFLVYKENKLGVEGNTNMTTEQDNLSVTGTFTAGVCEHRNGWYGMVPFWVFEKQVFCCHDCGRLLHGTELKTFRKKERKRLSS